MTLALLISVMVIFFSYLGLDERSEWRRPLFYAGCGMFLASTIGLILG